jgi:hypothetical protein
VPGNGSPLFWRFSVLNEAPDREVVLPGWAGSERRYLALVLHPTYLSVFCPAVRYAPGTQCRPTGYAALTSRYAVLTSPLSSPGPPPRSFGATAGQGMRLFLKVSPTH